MECKRRFIVVAGLYALAHLTFSIISTFTVSYERRVQTKKDLFDGPLVMRDTKMNKNSIFSVHLLNKEVFDQPVEFHTITPAKVNRPHLPLSFIKTFQKKARALVPSRPNRQLFFTLVNEAYIKMTLNWLCNTLILDQSIHNRTLIVGTSQKVCTVLTRQWNRITCIPLNLGADFEKSLSWGKQAYIFLLTLRAQLLLHLVKVNVPFVLFETDAVWFRDPSELFYNATLVDDADLVLPLKGYPDKSLTLAFDPLYVLPTDTTKAMLTELVRRLIANPKLFDQDVLDAMCKRQWRGLVCRTLEWEEVADGKWFKLSERERLTFHPFIVNNNFYVGVENKMARQAINGLWFLTKMDQCLKSKVKKALTKYQ